MDSPSGSLPLDANDGIIRRLVDKGVPKENLDTRYEGLVNFVMDNWSWVPEVVSAILPTEEEVAEFIKHDKSQPQERTTDSSITVKNQFHVGMLWLQWLMFKGDPSDALENLDKMSVGQRGVCGAVWGHNDIAYRCRSCEHDPTCAICVPCFQNGNHEGHDYSIIYTGGGCCDCGDETAWKREGFCSKHKGAEQIQPLPENLANSVGPVLNSLFVCWKNKLLSAETIFKEKRRANDHDTVPRKIANELTFVVVEMLLEFVKHSESLLSFVSERVISLVGLLEILVRAERFLSKIVVRKLHELLLKLLGEPVFKYEFAKVFLSYYPVVIKDAIKEGDSCIRDKYPLLSTFSVQILTVPTLILRLVKVKEMNLLSMLFGCLGEIFFSTVGDDGRLGVSKWGNVYETTHRVLGDIRFVLSHDEVSKYAIHDQQDICRIWIKFLAFLQGMNPIKRETGIHIEDENESMHLLLVLSRAVSDIYCLLVDRAFSVGSGEEMNALPTVHNKDTDDGDSLRHAKVGRLSQESSVCGVTGRSSAFACLLKSSGSHLLIPSSVEWLVYECLRAMENWLGTDDGTSTAFDRRLPPNCSRTNGTNVLVLKETLSKIQEGKRFLGQLDGGREDHRGWSSSLVFAGLLETGDLEKGHKNRTTVTVETNSVARVSLSLDADAVEEDSGMESNVESVFSLSEWPDINYDVSSQEISVHLPLHRLLSLLIQKALKRCYGEWSVPNVNSSNSAIPLSASSADFFGYVLGKFHPVGFSGFVMEHPLRIRVFCSQVNAGMWRKNGDATQLFCDWYRSVRWSDQGLEFDLFLLQLCAAMAPPDLFVKRILDRFGLSSYLSLSLERSSKYEPVLVKEMLTLIIQILQERRFSGFITADNLKRELIYKLAIGDSTHSQLVKSLPRDLSKCGQLQEILDCVAVYSNPSGFNQGMYSLRWAYWKELDLYHPRWNSRDLQTAEERYMRFCGVSALTTQMPKWRDIYPPLQGVARIATCRMTLKIIRAVLFYAVFTDQNSESRAPDGIIISALHLLSLALDICSQQKQSSAMGSYVGDSTDMLAFAAEDISEAFYYGVGKQSLLSLLDMLMRMNRKENPDNVLEAGNCSFSPLIESLLKKFAEIDTHCITKLQNLAPEVVGNLSPKVPNCDTNLTGPGSDIEKRKAKARERQAAILEKMKAEQSKFLSNISTTDTEDLKSEVCNSDSEHDSLDAAQYICSLCHDPNSKSPVSFLIHLQKSRLLSFVDKGPTSWDDRSDKAHASIPINIIVDQYGENTSSSGSSLASPMVQLTENVATEPTTDGQEAQMDVNAVLEFVRSWFPMVGSNQERSMSGDRMESHVYTFEKLEEDMYEPIRKGMHDGMLITNIEKDEKYSAAESCQESSYDTESIMAGKYITSIPEVKMESPSSLETHCDRESTSKLPVYDGFSPVDCDGIYLSSCGHAVHEGCLDRYLSSLKERHVRRNIYEGAHILDLDQGEFLCPVCRQLANSVLPALHGNFHKAEVQPLTSKIDSTPVAGPLCTSNAEIYSFQLQQALSLIQSAANVVGRPDMLEALPFQMKETSSQNLELVSRRLSKIYFPIKQDKLLESPRLSHPIIFWDTLKYSLMSIEVAARSGRASMAPNYSLESLYKEFKSSSRFILSLLLKVVQNMKSRNSLHMLQRFRGVQLIAQSICSGVSSNYHSIKHQQGDFLNMLNHDKAEVTYPDIQFWNRVTDPVLAHDPFSSLMWVLYCLPCPFISCKESLLSIVHIFYAVSMVQAVITCLGKNCHKITELGLHDCLITDICKVLRDSKCTQKYFFSEYVDPSCDIKDMIRRLSFPYLRRCALLWKLLSSSISSPFCDKDEAYDISSHATNDMMDITEAALVELNEVQELENMFKIPPLDVVLNDKHLRSLTLKWLYHFHEESEVRRFQSVFHCNPAVPFYLMNLPHVYQDLLQRYIKQQCPDCKVLLEEPALCLLCGKLCNSSWKSCCRERGCSAHAMSCGAGIGIFLLIRKTIIQLQRCSHRSVWPSPYLDAFGEEDNGMARGKPLYLNEERYAALTYMVASHGLDQSPKVLGQTIMDTLMWF
ncbi:hypothetical protein SLA2020_507030 [Shorea laevis]